MKENHNSKRKQVRNFKTKYDVVQCDCRENAFLSFYIGTQNNTNKAGRIDSTSQFLTSGTHSFSGPTTGTMAFLTFENDKLNNAVLPGNRVYLLIRKLLRDRWA